MWMKSSFPSDRRVKGPNDVHGDELAGSLEAHEQRKKKKEETLDQALQTKASIKDENVENKFALIPIC